jgi:hypothetical protein
LAGFHPKITSEDEKVLASFLSLVTRPEAKILCSTEDSEQTYILEDALKECDVFDEALGQAVMFLKHPDLVDKI